LLIYFNLTPLFSTEVRSEDAMGCKAPLFLALLLFLAGWGAAQARTDASQDKDDVVYLDLHTIEVQDIGPIYKDEITMSKFPVHPSSGSPLCSACEDFANKTVSYLSDKQTQDKIVEILHDACSQTFSFEQKCVELMDSYATLLFTKITEIEPEEFCKQCGLCREVALFSGVTSDSTCVVCRHLLDEVTSKLQDPDAEFEIIQILLKECNKIEGHAQQCKRLVLQYIPLIMVNGEKFLEKNDVCALVQACDASQKRAIGSFLETGLLSDAWKAK
jgi:saposin